MAAASGAEPFRPEELIKYRPRRADWVSHAMALLKSDLARAADTHLIRLDLKGFEKTPIYLKDESTHLTGSLKHRLARSLFLYSICNGLIGPDTTVVEASSGSTAVSEAYYARLLALPYIAVMPRGTSRAKIGAIERFGGRCHFVDSADCVYAEAERLAEKTGGHYLDQFKNAECATDWRGNNNIAESIFSQMADEPHPVPEWIVMSAGTGGTSATIGRYIRYRGFATRLCVPDPEHSVFAAAWESGCRDLTGKASSRIEGIGRPRVEPSFIAGVVDSMIKVPDKASIAAMRILSDILFRKVGASSGTNFFGALCMAAEMRRSGRSGSIVTVICDSGERYLETCCNEQWLKANGLDSSGWRDRIKAFLKDCASWNVPS
ncbi:MAG: PLP-dependent cysteine synthase family protein [Hyphomicrobiales bacterium]